VQIWHARAVLDSVRLLDPDIVETLQQWASGIGCTWLRHMLCGMHTGRCQAAALWCESGSPSYYAQTMFADCLGDQVQLVRLLTRILAHHGTVR
jgi:hypothetical protein